jgi:hypothetical protein
MNDGTILALTFAGVGALARWWQTGSWNTESSEQSAGSLAARRRTRGPSVDVPGYGRIPGFAPGDAPPELLVERSAYKRRKKGGRRRTVHVSASDFYIQDPGRPGRRARGGTKGYFAGTRPWITRKGKLGGPGFLTKSRSEQKALLDACVAEYGYRSCLGSITVLERSTAIRAKHGKTLAALRGWLKRSYGGAGTFGPRKKARRAA